MGGTGGKETLSDLGLVPQSVLLVKWEDEGMNGAYPLRTLPGPFVRGVERADRICSHWSSGTAKARVDGEGRSTPGSDAKTG